MNAGGVEAFVKLVLVLLLGGGGEQPQAPAVPMDALYPGNSCAYAELSVANLRSALANDPGLKPWLYGPLSRAEAFEQAAQQVSAAIGVPAQDLERAAESLQRVGFWLVDFGDDEEMLRLMVVVQLADEQPQLEMLLGRAKQLPDFYRRVQYGQYTLHVLGDGEDENVWLAQKGRRIFASLDPLTLQRTLLQSDGSKSFSTSISVRISGPDGDVMLGRPGQKGISKDAVLAVRSDVSTLLDAIAEVSADNHDLEEFMMFSAVMDFAAWQGVDVKLQPESVTANVELAPASHARRVLSTANEAPGLLKALPEDCFMAYVARLSDSEPLNQLMQEALMQALAIDGENETYEEIVAEIKDDLGIDLFGQVVPQMAEIGWIMPTFTGDLEDSFGQAVLAFRCRDSEGARQMLRRLAGSFQQEIYRLRKSKQSTRNGADVWVAGERTVMAVSGDILLLSPFGEGLDDVLQSYQQGGSAWSKQTALEHPTAGGWAIFSPAVLAEETPSMAPLARQPVWGLRLEPTGSGAELTLEAEWLKGLTGLAPQQ